MQTVIESAADELGLSPDDLVTQGVRQLLERQLRNVQIEIYQIASAYGVRSVQELDNLYRTDELEEATSWRDVQRLDHLEYKRDRLQSLLESIA
ncbi:MAG: hypothetical protein ACK47M_23710 [Caldilinea sp.]